MLTNNDRILYTVLLLNALGRYLQYIDNCERQCIRNDVAEMTANMSEIRAYNVCMRENPEKRAYTITEMDILDDNI